MKVVIAFAAVFWIYSIMLLLGLKWTDVSCDAGN